MKLKLMLLLSLAMPASADTLADALASAYASNPDLAAQRAVVRQVDELVPQAIAAVRPAVTPSASLQQVMGPSFQNEGRLFSGGVTISQPLFRGGRTWSSIEAGEQRIFAARARLRLVENSVLVNTLTAYADVLRTAEIVKLNENQVRVLEQQLRASRDRFEVGDLTRTDVAQSEARLANANSNLIAAQGAAIAAQQAYQRVVGRPPVDLAPIPPLPPLPASAAEALALARDSAPTLLAARFDEGAAKADVRTARGQWLPTVTLNATGTYQELTGLPNGVGTRVVDGFAPGVGVTASIPLYSGGLTGSAVRQAQARQSQLLELIASADRAVVEAVNNGWAGVETARATQVSAKSAIAANALAAEGVRQENSVGSRTILEVLNAEQELLNSRVTLAQADRDVAVATYTLLASIGRAEAIALGLPVEAYDVAVNAKRVRGIISDWNVDPDPRRTPERNHAKKKAQ
ncbi:TolC family outer membrane protein [Sandaracinobacteroides saxicola]|uniref:TolC family outer membrane protein n=1 Tax=Sandaracinobacteroides saxicola TaxID=2759707 RepID=A0A7G5IJW8_9SPHN|nr:TolC family outer membrane protein [Sandaracinobacteroides saxicola]QMW23660.1 TolC family outer membrane protein [Sandaracinobacteroides saxicola]